MTLHKSSRFLIALPLVALGAYGVAGAAPAATLAPACTVTADTVKTGQPNLLVNARLSEQVGDTLTATVAPDSKITVTSVQKGNTPMTAQLMINSEHAVVGEWNLTVDGKNGSCAGKVIVTAMD
jgi:hypothetical protein